MTAEHDRLEAARAQKAPWKKWGPYLSERQWGTVREDYSEGGHRRAADPARLERPSPRRVRPAVAVVKRQARRLGLPEIRRSTWSFPPDQMTILSFIS
jgi:hypothetical protein